MHGVSMKKVLVVEDEQSIRRFISINLSRNDFEVLEASNGQEALLMMHKNNPDVVVLDIMLPDMDGFVVCEKIRNFNQKVIILMLTARTQDMDKIMGLELGADDYMTKPFNPLELVARIRSILRRVDQQNAPIQNEITIDTKSHQIYKNNELLNLSPKEYEMMVMFLNHPGEALSRDTILDAVWGSNFFGDVKTLDVHIRRLREKIEDDPSSPKYIETVWGYGYRWNKGT